MKSIACVIIYLSISLLSFGQDVVWVQGSTFTMGSSDGNEDEKPPHSTKVNDFYIGRYEVTVKEYKEYCTATGTKMPTAPVWGWIDNHPIVNVNWTEATKYCEWLAKKTGLKFRLPTEAEWEYAAKGGSLSKSYLYSGSNNADDVAWYDENSEEKGTNPVGSLKPNELNIYDMSGNVWEWCADNYMLYSALQGKTPTVGITGKETRVLRGGGWYYDIDFSRVTARDGPELDLKNPNYGFRVARNK